MSIRMKGAALGVALVLSAPAWADDVSPVAAEAKSETKWVTDFDKAVEQAKKEKKDLLVDFTGSEWCVFCQRLEKEVLSHDEFVSAVTKQYVLVSLDFDQQGQATSKCASPARANELLQKHEIHSFPTIYMMTPDGEVFGKAQYQPGGPEKYVEYLTKIRDVGLPALTSAKAILAELAAAKDGDRAAVYEKAAAALVMLDHDAVAVPLLAGPVKTGFDSDPENKSGLRVKCAKALLKSGAGDEAVIDAASKLDPKNETGLFELAIVAKAQNVHDAETAKAIYAEVESLFAAGAPKDKVVGKQLAVCGIQFAGHPKVMNDPAKVKEWAKRIRDLGYDDGDDRLKQYVDKVLAEAPKDAPK